jgi:hypothetical protein
MNNLNIIDSESQDVLNLIDLHKHKDIIIIFGNGAGINKISPTIYNKIYKNKSIFKLGIKRIYLKFMTDVLLYGDEYMEHEYTRSKKIIHKDTQIIKLNRQFSKLNIHKWLQNKSFDDLPNTGIWHLRNSLIGALHMCWLLQIKTIILTGVDFDSRLYFFGRHPKFGNTQQPYETKPPLNYEYSLYQIVYESLTYLVANGYTIYYTDKSKLLDSIHGINKTTWTKINTLFLTPDNTEITNI